MIKLVISDMDGSLLHNDKRLPKDYPKLVEELSEKGVIMGIASGRQYANLFQCFPQVADKMLFISDNGGLIAMGEEILYCEEFLKEQVCELLRIAEGIADVTVVLCGRNSAYLLPCSQEVEEQIKKYYALYQFVDDLTMVDDQILKLAFLDLSKEGSQGNVYTYYRTLSDRYQVVVSAKEWMDICLPSTSKGNAILKIQQLYDIKSDETMVFGDYLNDLSMMEVAEYSYAMANAHPELKKAAHFQCLSNEEEGVIETIKKMFKV